MQRALKVLSSALPLILAVCVGWLTLRSIGPPEFGVRVIGRTNDTTGLLQVIYEVTNRTSRDVTFALASAATRTVAGWRAASKEEQREMQISRMLGRRTAAAVRIVARSADLAVRGQVQYEKQDTPLKKRMKMLARRMGLPYRLRASVGSVWGDAIPFGVIRLPAVETSGESFLLATTAEGVWPRPPFTPPAHNFTVRNKPAAVLDLYRELSHAEVTVTPSVSLFGAEITIEPDHNIYDASEALHLIEDALRDQAGIVVTERSSNSVTFTWHERAKLKTSR
jgi:hypothetical protein